MVILSTDSTTDFVLRKTLSPDPLVPHMPLTFMEAVSTRSLAMEAKSLTELEMIPCEMNLSGRV